MYITRAICVVTQANWWALQALWKYNIAVRMDIRFMIQVPDVYNIKSFDVLKGREIATCLGNNLLHVRFAFP